MRRILKKIIRFGKNDDKEQKKDKKEGKAEEEKKEDNLMNMLMGAGQAQPDSRILMLHSELNEEKSMEIISTFLALTELVEPKKELKKGEKPYDPITFYISTYGGSADEMFGIYDMMSSIKNKCIIETIGIGKVMSAGTLLLAAGTKGHRKIGKNCRVMLHQVSAAAMGPLFNMTTELEAIQKMHGFMYQSFEKKA
jgi:ATP-dependent Clp endopeptidase proteolytic subunit ClpP